jgi:type II secretion system protein I
MSSGQWTVDSGQDTSSNSGVLQAQTRRRKSRRGFTLIEMIIATVLLAVAIVGSLSAISSSTRAVEAGERIQTAALLAQRKLTELELQATNLTSGEQQGDFGAEFADYRWRAMMDTTEFEKLLKVTLLVSWGENGQDGGREFVTYLRNDADQTPEEQQENNPTETQSSETSGEDDLGSP